MKNTIGMLVATLFLARDLAHREHLKATGPGSFAAHSALGDFYTSVVKLADTLTETYQGRFERLIDIPLLANDTQGSILDTLRAQREWIREARYDAVPQEETPLHNIIDEVESLYCSIIYKLKFLA
jgi:hypothetical protein